MLWCSVDTCPLAFPARSLPRPLSKVKIDVGPCISRVTERGKVDFLHKRNPVFDERCRGRAGAWRAGAVRVLRSQGWTPTSCMQPCMQACLAQLPASLLTSSLVLCGNLGSTPALASACPLPPPPPFSLELLVDGDTAASERTIVTLEIWACHFLRRDKFKARHALAGLRRAAPSAQGPSQAAAWRIVHCLPAGCADVPTLVWPLMQSAPGIH